MTARARVGHDAAVPRPPDDDALDGGAAFGRRGAVAAFRAVLAPEVRVDDADALERALDAAWRRAREAHPALAIDAVALFAFAGAGLRDGDAATELERRHAADLYLACGCARGDPRALAILEEQVMPVVARGLARLPLASDGGRELLQVLRERMLVEKDGRRGITGYDGRAPLATWLRVCAGRIGTRAADRAQREEELDDARLDQLAPGVPDPQLAYLRRLYGDQFEAAFRDAVAELAPRERNLLRHAVLDGLGIDQIAAIYHVHRSTAARQLAQARANLVAATRERMRLALGVSEAELESILRVIMSLADVTLRHLLAREEPSEI